MIGVTGMRDELSTGGPSKGKPPIRRVPKETSEPPSHPRGRAPWPHLKRAWQVEKHEKMLRCELGQGFGQDAGSPFLVGFSKGKQGEAHALFGFPLHILRLTMSSLFSPKRKERRETLRLPTVRNV